MREQGPLTGPARHICQLSKGKRPGNLPAVSLLKGEPVFIQFIMGESRLNVYLFQFPIL